MAVVVVVVLVLVVVAVAVVAVIAVVVGIPGVVVDVVDVIVEEEVAILLSSISSRRRSSRRKRRRNGSSSCPGETKDYAEEDFSYCVSAGAIPGPKVGFKYWFSEYMEVIPVPGSHLHVFEDTLGWLSDDTELTGSPGAS